MIDIIKSRRSTRKFKPDMITDEELNKVIESAVYAPSGCNVQTAHYIVIKNREILDNLAELVRKEFAGMTADDNTFGSIRHSIEASRSGNYIFHYNPAVLIIAANSVDNPNAIADTACAIENMMLVANSLNLGSCWINQLRWLQDNVNINNYLHSLGMKEGEKVYASLALGYPDTESGMPDKEPLKRFGNIVTVVE